MQRLSKILMESGVASRRKCDDLIKDGFVVVNGETIYHPYLRFDTEKDAILVKGKPLIKKEKKWYFLLNKPKGFVCSNDATKNKKRVVDIFSHIKERLYTVGRLDKSTTGLIIVTNDGNFAHRVIHPSFNIEKEYLVKTTIDISHEGLVAISKGTTVEGTFVKPTFVHKVRRNTIKVGVKEGKKHEVRKLVQKINAKILDLRRIRIGPIVLNKLPIGSYREMSRGELEAFSSLNCR